MLSGIVPAFLAKRNHTTFCDAMTDVACHVVARHALFVHDRRSLALTLSDNSDQHMIAGNLLSSEGLHVHHRALDYTVEAHRRLGALRTVGCEFFPLGFDVGDQ